MLHCRSITLGRFMDTVVLSFHLDNDDCIEFELVVDSLDPICNLIDDDDDPPVPEFAGWVVHDSSYGATGGRNAFMVDYGAEQEDLPIDANQVEQVARAFLSFRYGISILGFERLPSERLPPSHPSPRH